MDQTTYKAVNRARIALTHGEKTFVIVGENTPVHYSAEHRVKPFLDLIDANPSLLDGAIVGDRIVGRAAALLCVYSKIKAVFAVSISDEAIDILGANNILATWQDTVEYIVEKDLKSRYKLDEHLKGIDDPAQAFEKIKKFEAEFAAQQGKHG